MSFSRPNNFVLICCLAGLGLFFTVGEAFATGENVEILQRIQNVPERPQTISGFSSGGTMSHHMQVAFSSNFDGAAMFGSIWYRCGPYGEIDYRTICSKGYRNVTSGIADAKRYAEKGLIDPLENLKNQLVYHYIGYEDELINSSIRAQMETFYEEVGMNRDNINFVYKHAVHSIPTVNTSDPPCSKSQILEDAIGKEVGAAYCDYYGAYEAMNYLFKNQLVRPQGKVALEKLRYFDQSAFLAPLDRGYLDPIGFLYVPSKCKDGNLTCPLHVALHGCAGSRSNVQTRFAERSGYLEVSEVNNIILLMPQSKVFFGNVLGCWDIAGYSGSDYATKRGVQTEALAKMIGTVTGARFNLI